MVCLEDLIFGQSEGYDKCGRLIVPCSSKYLDYLQEEIRMLDLYHAVITQPFSLAVKEHTKPECFRYTAHTVQVNDSTSEFDGMTYRETETKLLYKIYGDRQFYFNICPFHLNSTGYYSFMIDDRKNLFYCLGCGSGGSAFEFIEEIYDLASLEAIKVLSTLLYLKTENLDENWAEDLKKLGVPNRLSPLEWAVSLNIFKGLSSVYYEDLITKADEKRKKLFERTDQYIEKLEKTGRLDAIKEYMEAKTPFRFEDFMMESKIQKMANRICVEEKFFRERVKQYKKIQ